MRSRQVTHVRGEARSRRSTEVDRDIGARVRSLRERHGITQATLAEMLGLSLQQVQKYESGETRLPASRVLQIADCLRADVTELMVGAPAAPVQATASRLQIPPAHPSEFVEVVAAFASIRNPGSRTKVIEMAKFFAQLERSPSSDYGQGGEEERSAPLQRLSGE
jgi:transcriptional regulator with XRE-family HTH domain